MYGTVTKRVWGSTPYLHATALDTSKPGRLVLLIPGNPGLCEFYEKFIDEMQEQLPDAEFYCVSYLGYNIDKPNPNEPLHMLDEQIEHKVKFLDFAVTRFYGQRKVKPQVHLLGHSVGAWICQRVVAQRPGVASVCLLTPTIRNIAQSERGVPFTRLTRFVSPVMVWCLVLFLNWLASLVLPSNPPRWLTRLAWPSHASESFKNTVKGIIQSPAICRQIYGMAIEEMQRIGPEIDGPDVGDFWDHPAISLIFARNDHWVSDETKQSLMDYLTSRNNIAAQSLGIAHAFVTKDNARLARCVALEIGHVDQ